jgi:fatty-acyl-CoA synthase
MQGNMMQYPLTLTHILERAGQLFGAVEIVSRRPDGSVHRTSYADLYRRARALGGALQNAGVKPGDRVATLMWNGYRHLECYFGIPAIGAVLHTLNLRLHPDELAYIVNHAEDRVLIVEDVLLPLFESFRAQVKPERVIVVRNNDDATAYEDYEAVLAQRKEIRYASLDENDACALCYTSGTTGKPKGVLYSHRALALHSLAMCLTDSFAISQSDVVMATMPMFHANAWGVPFAAVMAGSQIVFPGRACDASSLLELIDSERVTFSGGVPTVWLAIAQALETEPKRWRTAGLRCIIAGSACPESLLRRLDVHGIRAVQAWGLTETSPIATVAVLRQEAKSLAADEQYRLRARQGPPVPFVDMRAIGDNGDAAWDDHALGEVQVRGPWIAQSYFRAEDQRDKWTDDGWFRTGDVGAIDAQGSMRIADRTKDLIKSGGEWISSVDLENAIVGHPDVAEAAVVAVPHPKWAERPLAVVVPRPGAKLSCDQLRNYLLTNCAFAKWQLPEDFCFVSELPHTSTGKLLKTALRRQYAEWKWNAGEMQN